MRRILGVSLSISLGLMALAAVPATANSDNATDVGKEGLGPCSVDVGGVAGETEDYVVRWKGDTTTIMCKFKDLDMEEWDGVKYVDGNLCGLPENPDPPNQPFVETYDMSWRVNAQGNGTLRCWGTQPT
jgi:hypothetical protein